MDAQPQPVDLVHSQRVDVEEAVSDHRDSARCLLDADHVHLDVAPLGLGRELAAVLPRRLAQLVREGCVALAAAQPRVHAPQLERLVHRL